MPLGGVPKPGENVHTRRKSTWEMWTLSEEDISQVAKSMGISRELSYGEMELIARGMKKSVEVTLEEWEDLLRSAIEDVMPMAKRQIVVGSWKMMPNGFIHLTWVNGQELDLTGENEIEMFLYHLRPDRKYVRPGDSGKIPDSINEEYYCRGL